MSLLEDAIKIVRLRKLFNESMQMSYPIARSCRDSLIDIIDRMKKLDSKPLKDDDVFLLPTDEIVDRIIEGKRRDYQQQARN